MTIAEYARHRKALGLVGGSYQAVSYAVSSGRIPISAQGLIDAAQADEAWKLNTQPFTGKRGVGRPKGTGKNQKAKAAAEKGDQAPQPPAKSKGRDYVERGELPPVMKDNDVASAQLYNRSRAQKEAYLARIAKLEYEEKSGSLVPVDRVGKVMFATGRAFRTKMTALASSLASTLVGMDDEHEIRAVLDREFRTILSEMAADLGKVVEKADAEVPEGEA
jgi:hypothetical protein